MIKADLLDPARSDQALATLDERWAAQAAAEVAA
jgi:hypothetical protein